jgi:hypothetical protein
MYELRQAMEGVMGLMVKAKGVCNSQGATTLIGSDLESLHSRSGHHITEARTILD